MPHDTDLTDANLKQASTRQLLQLFVLCTFATLVAALPYVQCLGDDTFIYMRMIKRFLTTGRFEYNPGEPCYAMTSVTWFLAWAGGTWVAGSMEAARYLLSVAFHMLALLGVFLLGRRMIKNILVFAVVMIAIFFDPFYLRWFWAGWETAPKVAAAAFMIIGLVNVGDSARRISGAIWAGIMAGLGILTRPELILLALIGLIYLALRLRQGRASILLAYVLGTTIITLPWFIYAHLVFGWIIPHTVFAKMGGGLSAVYLRWAIPKLFSILFIATLPLYAAAIFVLLRVPPDFLKPFAKTWTDDAKARFLDWALVVLWGVVVFGYAVTGSYIESIKTCLFTPFLLLAAGAVVDGSLEKKTSVLPRHALAVAGVLLLIMSFAVQTRLYYRFAIWNPRYRGGEDASFIQLARTIRERTEPSDRIGLWELGVIGYYSERYILDFVGLASPDIVSYKLRYGHGHIERYLHEHQAWPEYIVDAIPSQRLAEMDLPEREFFTKAYRPVYFEDVRRIGGREKPGDFYRYTLYRRHD